MSLQITGTVIAIDLNLLATHNLFHDGQFRFYGLEHQLQREILHYTIYT
jgi:hypothetical protein